MAANMLQLILVLATVAVTSVLGQLTGREERELELGQNPALLELAARTGESRLIEIDGPQVIESVQENVNAMIWCLPWLQRFPGGSIRWLVQRFDEDFEETVPPGALPTELLPPGDTRISIGGQFNEWLNITRTILVVGAESADTGIYTCEVCRFRGTAFEDCHSANVSLQVIGGPPFVDTAMPNDPPLVSTDVQRTYRIGSDFCLEPGFSGIVTILCDVINQGEDPNGNLSRAFPTPDRAWFQNGDLLDSASILNPLGDDLISNTAFFTQPPNRMLLMPGVWSPDVISFPTGEQEGALSLSYQLLNTTLSLGMMPGDIQNIEAARSLTRMALLGSWRCEVNNTFGSDGATSEIRVCADAPSLPGCDGGSSSILFAQSGDTVPVGCTVCIPEGNFVTLDCTGTGMADITYEWQDGSGSVVSTDPLLTVGAAGNYSCTAMNVDNAPEFLVSVLAFSQEITFMAQTTEQFVSTPRSDNGCSRLRNQTVVAGVGLCPFVGETATFDCTDNAMTPLEITTPGGSIANGSVTITVGSGDEGDYSCRLSSNTGPCSQGTETLRVEVFDPARIRRTDTPDGCNFVAGAPTSTVPTPPVTDPPTSVTLCCPYEGIENPVTNWYRIVVDDLGCASEELVTSDLVDSDGVLRLTTTIPNDITYVCRTVNNAGMDADIVSFRTEEAADWSLGPFSDCSEQCRDGTRTRSVVCRDRNEAILPSFECFNANGPPPSSVESCAALFPDICLNFPVWVPDRWSQCTQQCGGGYRFRLVRCIVPMSGAVMLGSDCAGQPRPNIFDFDGCAAECCLENSEPDSCKNSGPGFCSDPSFANRCCWTCGLKVVGGGR